MEDLNEGIVEEYAGYLQARASSVAVRVTAVGLLAGAALGAAPGFLSHSLISGGTKYFAVLLGAIAGGVLGRTIGEKQALGLRLQAQMALRQLQFERRFVRAPSAPAARPAAPAPASPAVAAPPVPAPAAQVAAQVIPPAVRPPLAAPAPTVSAPTVSAPSTPAPAPAAPVTDAPAPPASPPATATASPSPVLTEAPLAAAPAGPRLAGPSAPALPPLSARPS